jgi:hypothetical protein
LTRARRHRAPDDGAGHGEFAWRVHGALLDATAKVDVKASIIMTFETALLGLVGAFSEATKPLGALHGPAIWAYRAGIALLVCAIALAGAAVFPYLARADARRDWHDGTVYFGHLRHWEPAPLGRALAARTTSRRREALAEELIALAGIAWWKHTMLQASMVLAGVSSMTIAISPLAG